MMIAQQAFNKCHAKHTWQGCSLPLALPIPSTVVIAIPSIEQSGARQALIDLCLFFSSMT